MMMDIVHLARKLIYDDQYSSFTQLDRVKDDSTIHQQNIETLMKDV